MINWDLLDEDFEKEYFEDNFTVIVTYDIISNKRRTFLHKILSGFGFSVQKSVFECILTKEKYEILLRKINIFVQPEDLIRIYKLNQNVKAIIYGERLQIENEDFYFI